MANDEEPEYPVFDRGTPYGWHILESFRKAVEQKNVDWFDSYHAYMLVRSFEDIKNGVEPKKALDLIRKKKKPHSRLAYTNEIKNAMGVIKYHREGKKIPSAMEAVWKDENYPAKSYKKVKKSYEKFRKIAIYHIENDIPAEEAPQIECDVYITPVLRPDHKPGDKYLTLVPR